ncbi:MAG: DUF2382 domain-containing protein [Candidatus Limnocylindria bacterium]
MTRRSDVRRSAHGRPRRSIPPARLGSADRHVPIYEERAEATKDARVIEKLNLNKAAYTDTERVEETVRREEFDIDDSRGGESTSSRR